MSRVKTYTAKVGCWNCDNIYEIDVTHGIVTPLFIQKEKPKCERCGCASLRMLAEYKAEKRIMKDILLHDHVEHVGEIPSLKKNEHSHIQ